MIIDAHVHVFPALSEEYPRVVDELAPPGREAPVELLLQTMDAAGVDGAVLVPLGPEDDYVLKCVRRYPGRFLSVGVADPASLGLQPGVDAADSLSRRVARTGIRALRMNWLGEPGRPLRDSPAYPALRWMAEHGLLLWFYGPPGQLTQLARATAEFPELTVVLNHMGFCPERIGVDELGRPRCTATGPPPTLAAVLELADFPSVRIMFSGQYAFSRDVFPYPDLDPVAQRLYRVFGASRLMWASDFPWPCGTPGYQALLTLPRRQLPSLTDAESEAIYAGAAMAAFPGGWGR